MLPEPDRTELILLVAHGMEATPLRQQFDLAPVASRPFKLYRNEAGISLVVSGMGKSLAAAAVAYAAARIRCSQTQTEDSSPGFLNLGIAGHGRVEVGTGLVINKITDGASGQSVFPSPLTSGFASSELVTVDRPQLDYPAAVGYDMEAYGYFVAASRFTVLDLIQSFKIISDNPGSSVSQIDKALVTDLFRDNAGTIQRLVTSQQARVRDYHHRDQTPAAFQRALELAHFTVTERHQLHDLCRRCVVLGLADRLEQLTTEGYRNADELLGRLRQQIEQAG